MTPEERIATLESQLSLMKARFEMLLTYVKMHVHGTTESSMNEAGRTTWDSNDTKPPDSFWMDGVQYPEEI